MFLTLRKLRNLFNYSLSEKVQYVHTAQIV